MPSNLRKHIHKLRQSEKKPVSSVASTLPRENASIVVKYARPLFVQSKTKAGHRTSSRLRDATSLPIFTVPTAFTLPAGAVWQ